MSAQTEHTIASLLAAFDEVEIWRAAVGWQKYEVSSWGNVRRKGSSKNLIPHLTIHGYRVVSFSENNVAKPASIHRVVAMAFIGPPQFENAIVAHNDGDKENCRASNLRWASSRENQADSVRHYTRVRGSAVHGAKLSEADIPVIRQRIAAGEKYASIGADFGVGKDTICLIKKNAIWKHARGAVWGASK